MPRVSDLPFVIPAIAGKVEFETVEDGKEEQILDKLIQGAVARRVQPLLQRLRLR